MAQGRSLPYTGSSLLAFTLGATAWIPLNYGPFNFQVQAQETIERWNDFSEILLSRALAGAKLVSITLKSRKVYIGFVTGGLDPVNERKYVNLLPMHSGYRDEKTQDLVLLTNYAAVYAKIIQENNKAALEGIQDFRLVLPMAEIQSLNLFDPSAYKLFKGL